MSERNQISKLIANALASPIFGLTFADSEITELLETPKDPLLGDYAFPCFIAAKRLRKPPVAVAQELAKVLLPLVSSHKQLTKVEASGPYLNFFVCKSELASRIVPAILDGTFLAPRESSGEKVMVEYSQPNTHKAFHVGHIRCAALGDSISRILTWIGFQVVPVNYIGDEGTHVAKCLWYYSKYFQGEIPAENLGEFLGDMYVKATDLLDLSKLTRAPYPGVVAAQVKQIYTHPAEPKWMVVVLNTHLGEKTVVTGVTGPRVGDLVPYAPPEARLRGKQLKSVDKKGILSEGMLFSEAELGLTDNNSVIPILPSQTKIGTEVSELYRIDGAVSNGESVLAELSKREKEVGAVLSALESADPKIGALWKQTKEWSMQEFYSIYGWLNCHFDHYFFESEFGELGKELVRKYQAQGVFVESEGAVGADLARWDLGFCILIKSDGTALYATRDLALASKKFEKFGVDRSIYVVDAGQALHFRQVFKCLELMGYKNAKNCLHLSYGRVVRPDGKMSSRKGNVILFSQLRQRLIDKVTSEYLENYRGEWSDEEIDSTAYRIALATMRYGMLTQENNSDIVFDLEEWTNRSGNTGPYMMYAYARTRSILREVGAYDKSLANWSLLQNQYEVELILHLHGYHDTLSQAANIYSPHLIATWVYELSKRFSRMYTHCSVKSAESAALKSTRAMLVEATGLVIEHALGLLGIRTVERM